MRTFVLLLLAGMTAASVGCAGTMAKLRGDHFSADDNKAASEAGAFREKDPNAKSWGFSSKARDIERNMGVQ